MRQADRQGDLPHVDDPPEFVNTFPTRVFQNNLQGRQGKEETLDLKLLGVQRLNIRAPGGPVEQQLGDEVPRRWAVLNAPARMSRGDPDARRGGLADERRPLVAEAHVPREVARLPGLDRRGGQRGRHRRDVGCQVVALRIVALHLVGCLGEGNVLVWLACSNWTVPPPCQPWET